MNLLLAISLSMSQSVIDNCRQIFLIGQGMGNRANVFSKVGDSNSANSFYLSSFDTGIYSLGSYSNLKTVITYFQGSHSRNSIATIPGLDSGELINSVNAPSECNGDSLLVCEYKSNKPAVAVILVGTNDLYYWWDFEGHYRDIIQTTISYGIIPVLVTKADSVESGVGPAKPAPHDYINDVIRRLAAEYKVPLLDLRLFVESLPNRGLQSDGIHYSYSSDGRTGYFGGSYTNYGYNMFNLRVLQQLDEIRRLVLIK